MLDFRDVSLFAFFVIFGAASCKEPRFRAPAKRRRRIIRANALLRTAQRSNRGKKRLRKHAWTPGPLCGCVQQASPGTYRASFIALSGNSENADSAILEAASVFVEKRMLALGVARLIRITCLACTLLRPLFRTCDVPVVRTAAEYKVRQTAYGHIRAISGDSA